MNTKSTRDVTTVTALTMQPKIARGEVPQVKTAMIVAIEADPKEKEKEKQRRGRSIIPESTEDHHRATQAQAAPM